MDIIYWSILLLTLILIVLNFIESKISRENFKNSRISHKSPKKSIHEPFSDPNSEYTTLAADSPLLRDDGTHRGLMDYMNQLPAPVQHYGNRNQMYDFSMYGDQPFVQCSNCKQYSNCVQYPDRPNDKFDSICTSCKNNAQINLIREMGSYPPEVQARAIGFPRICAPSM
jgi:hypothetical protein